MCWSAETKRYSPDLQEGELGALITCAEPGQSGLREIMKSKSLKKKYIYILSVCLMHQYAQ